MTTKKLTKAVRIEQLERQLWEALAGQIHTYHFADAAIEKTSMGHLMGSGVILTLTVLGGREVFKPVMIRNGLSKEAIAALRADFRRSYEEAAEYRPRGLTEEPK